MIIILTQFYGFNFIMQQLFLMTDMLSDIGSFNLLYHVVSYNLSIIPNNFRTDQFKGPLQVLPARVRKDLGVTALELHY